MEKVKNYIQLHLNILLFSLTSVFSKMASVQYNKHGLGRVAQIADEIKNGIK